MIGAIEELSGAPPGPEGGDAPGVEARRAADQERSGRRDSAPAGAGTPNRTHPDEAKTLATLQAEAALAGYELRRAADGVLSISRWNLTRQVPNLEAARAFIRRVVGRE